jgi:hypothetical protein
MATGPVLDPAMVARKLAAMSLGRAQAREARLAADVRKALCRKAFRKAGVAGGFSRFLSFSVLKWHQKWHQQEHVRGSTRSADTYRL